MHVGSLSEAADVQEDEIFGKDKRGDEMPDWASDKAKRLAKIQEAMAALEADAKLAAEEQRRIEAEKRRQRNAEGRKKPGKPAAPLPDEPDPKAQRNYAILLHHRLVVPHENGVREGNLDRAAKMTTMINDDRQKRDAQNGAVVAVPCGLRLICPGGCRMRPAVPR